MAIDDERTIYFIEIDQIESCITFTRALALAQSVANQLISK